MSLAFFPRVHRWHLPEPALTDSLAELASDGRDRKEGIVLWLGRRVDGDAAVSHLVLLRGPGIVRRPDLLRIVPALINDVTDLAIEFGVSLVGQIHSHGPGGGTDLSRTDRSQGISAPYYLSVVAPHFALKPRTRIADCGVHVFEPDLGYRRLSNAEVADRIAVSPGDRLPVLTVGQART